MDEPKLKLEYESRLKELIWQQISTDIDRRLTTYFAETQLLARMMPSDEAQEQLAVVEAICREIKQQLADFDLRSSRQSSLDVLSGVNLDLLNRFFKEGR